MNFNRNAKTCKVFQKKEGDFFFPSKIVLVRGHVHIAVHDIIHIIVDKSDRIIVGIRPIIIAVIIAVNMVVIVMMIIVVVVVIINDNISIAWFVWLQQPILPHRIRKKLVLFPRFARLKRTPTNNEKKKKHNTTQ